MQYGKLKTFLSSASLVLASTVFAWAENAFANDGDATVPDAKNVMDSLSRTSNASVDSIAKPILGIFGSAYDVAITLGIAIMVISVVLVGITFATSGGNGGKREEGKSQLIHIGYASIGIGAILTIASALLKAGASLG